MFLLLDTDTSAFTLQDLSTDIHLLITLKWYSLLYNESKLYSTLQSHPVIT